MLMKELKRQLFYGILSCRNARNDESETDDVLPTLSLVPFYRLKWGDSNTVLTFAELFFCVVEEEIANGRVVAFKAKCLLCGTVISPFGTEFAGSGRRGSTLTPVLTDRPF